MHNTLMEQKNTICLAGKFEKKGKLQHLNLSWLLVPCTMKVYYVRFTIMQNAKESYQNIGLHVASSTIPESDVV